MLYQLSTRPLWAYYTVPGHAGVQNQINEKLWQNIVIKINEKLQQSIVIKTKNCGKAYTRCNVYTAYRLLNIENASNLID